MRCPWRGAASQAGLFLAESAAKNATSRAASSSTSRPPASATDGGAIKTFRDLIAAQLGAGHRAIRSHRKFGLVISSGRRRDCGGEIVAVERRGVAGIRARSPPFLGRVYTAYIRKSFPPSTIAAYDSLTIVRDIARARVAAVPTRLTATSSSVRRAGSIRSRREVLLDCQQRFGGNVRALGVIR